MQRRFTLYPLLFLFCMGVASVLSAVVPHYEMTDALIYSGGALLFAALGEIVDQLYKLNSRTDQLVERDKSPGQNRVIDIDSPPPPS